MTPVSCSPSRTSEPSSAFPQAPSVFVRHSTERRDRAHAWESIGVARSRQRLECVCFQHRFPSGVAWCFASLDCAAPQPKRRSNRTHSPNASRVRGPGTSGRASSAGLGSSCPTETAGLQRPQPDVPIPNRIPMVLQHQRAFGRHTLEHGRRGGVALDRHMVLHQHAVVQDGE